MTFYKVLLQYEGKWVEPISNSTVSLYEQETPSNYSQFLAYKQSLSLKADDKITVSLSGKIVV